MPYKMNLKTSVLIIACVLIGNTIHCQENKQEIVKDKIVSKSRKLSNNELKNWYHKDYNSDTIPGISLEKLYNSGLLEATKNSEVIVAVIDTKLDINHVDLQQQIWINQDEIPNNGVDDDSNGYIDDLNGWDFLGNKSGEYLKYQSLEIVRIINKYKAIFETKDSINVTKQELQNFRKYKKAKNEYATALEEIKSAIDRWDFRLTQHLQSVDRINQVLKKETHTSSDLDSIMSSPQDSIVYKAANVLKHAQRNNRTAELYQHYKSQYSNMLKISLDLDYNERALIGDDPNDISDVQYGYNGVSGDVPFRHSVVVSGVIGANRANDIGVKGFSDAIKIMPVVMVASGDEHDKDVAMAIRYAVDNGAKVINMSWGKTNSLHENWVLEAIKYAAKNDVLLVHGAGNDGLNTDLAKYYPNDYLDTLDSNDKELVDNFIAVGASSYRLNEKLITSFSN